MPHVPEKSFKDTVEEKFRELFPEADIQTEPYLPESGRYPDLLVENTEFGNFAVEIENDFEAAFKGVGQALVYSGETGYTPVVVVPEGHVKEPEWTFLKRHVHGLQVSHNED